MAPTKTHTECDGGRVGKYFERRTVGASPDKAYVQMRRLVIIARRVVLTDFMTVGWQVVTDGILKCEIKMKPF